MIVSRNVRYNFSPRGKNLSINGDINKNINKYFFAEYLFTPCPPHPYSIKCDYHLIALVENRKVVGYLASGKSFIDVSKLY